MTVREIACGTWRELMDAVMDTTRDFERQWRSPSAVPFFRGHSCTDHQLVPGLFRSTPEIHYDDYAEQNFYYEFRARAGALLSTTSSSWDTLFLMQHHGVPTRLLDWTESFGTALFFALERAQDAIDIWMLDPYALNKHTFGADDIVDVEADIETEYFELFVRRDAAARPPAWSALAMYPRRQAARLASQHGLFTLHRDRVPLEQTGVPGLTRFRLDAHGLDETRRFLKVIGVNDFSLFPDLDGLSRLLRKRIKAGSYAVRA